MNCFSQVHLGSFFSFDWPCFYDIAIEQTLKVCRESSRMKLFSNWWSHACKTCDFMTQGNFPDCCLIKLDFMKNCNIAVLHCLCQSDHYWYHFCLLHGLVSSPLFGWGWGDVTNFHKIEQFSLSLGDIRLFFFCKRGASTCWEKYFSGKIKDFSSMMFIICPSFYYSD